MLLSHIIILLQILIFLCYCCNHITSDGSRDLYKTRLEHGLSFRCSTTTNTTNSFQNNLNSLLSDFGVQSSQFSFYNTSIGTDPDAVYGYYLCRGDLTRNLCSACILNGTKFVLKSGCDYKDGYFSSEKCFFGYSNHSTYGLLEKYSVLEFDYVETNVSNYQDFRKTLTSTIAGVIKEASFEKNKDGDGLVAGFATKEANVTREETIYSMAQCTPDILGVNCSKCLMSGFSSLEKWADGAPGGIAFMGKCQIRYDNVSFYDLEDIESSNGKGLRPNVLGVYSLVLLCMYYYSSFVLS